MIPACRTRRQGATNAGHPAWPTATWGGLGGTGSPRSPGASCGCALGPTAVTAGRHTAPTSRQDRSPPGGRLHSTPSTSTGSWLRPAPTSPRHTTPRWPGPTRPDRSDRRERPPQAAVAHLRRVRSLWIRGVEVPKRQLLAHRSLHLHSPSAAMCHGDRPRRCRDVDNAGPLAPADAPMPVAIHGGNQMGR